jgi:hypothetical protein
MIKKLGLVVLCFFILAGVTGCKKDVKDPFMAKVDAAIDRFMEKQIANFINTKDEVILDYYVVLSVKALENSGYPKLSSLVDTSKVQVYFSDYDYSSVTNLFKAIVIKKALGLNYDNEKAYVKDLKEVDIYSYAYGLAITEITGANDGLKQDLLTKINVIRDSDYRDADYAGVALIACANDDIDKTPLYSLIDSSLSKDGIMFWGEESASTTANVILGLIANGIDPTSPTYTTDGVNLIEALLAFETNGAFKNQLDGDVDLLFATSQGFAALVGYKLFVQNQKYNLFY